MALLFLDSFDHYVTADLTEKWTANASMTINAAAGRNSSAGLRGVSATNNCSRALPAAAGGTMIVGVAVKVTSLSTHICTIAESTGAHLQFWVPADGSIQVWRGAGGVGWTGSPSGTQLAATAAGVLAQGISAHLQVKAVIHDTAGSVEIRVNGVSVLTSATTLDTRNGGTGVPNMVYLGGANDLDDLYVLDGTGPAPHNDFLGDCRVDARYPTAEGASSAWSPLSGTDNALMVDETAPDDDTTYNATATIGATDTHVVADAPVPGAALLGVQLSLSTKKTDSGTCTLVPIVRHGTTDVAGPAISPGLAYAYAVTPYALNPGTGAAWTEADFNAAQFGYRRTA
jgi:hypothetical protein